MSPGAKGSAVWSNQEIKAGAEEGAKPGGREASGLDWFTFLGRHNLCSVQALCWALEAPRIQLRICLWEVLTHGVFTRVTTKMRQQAVGAQGTKAQCLGRPGEGFRDMVTNTFGFKRVDRSLAI